MPSTILVTGGNRGIGYEAVRLLSEKKAGTDTVIILASRSTKNGEEAIEKMKSSSSEYKYDNIKVVELDITSKKSLQSAAEHVKSTYNTLDVLIHNSAISNAGGDWKSNQIFEVNIRGTKDTFDAFTPIMTPQTGIITFVSSMVGPWYMSSVDSSTQKMLDVDDASWENIEDWMKDYDTFHAGGENKYKWVPEDQGMIASTYCASKAIVNPWFRSFTKANPKVKFAAVCPGYCATELNGFQGPRPASKGGESVIWPALNEFENGGFYQDGRQLTFGGPVPKFAMEQLNE